MTLTLELTQEEETKIDQARHYGIDMTRMIKGLIAGLPAWEPKTEMVLPSPENLSTEERLRLWEDFCSSAVKGVPPLSDVAISRESMYGERG